MISQGGISIIHAEKGELMKKLILIFVLVIAAIWAMSEIYTLKSATSADGSYNLVLINQKTGTIHRLMGK